MKIKRITQILLCLALLVVMGGEFLLSAFSVTASADVLGYSNVLTDLRIDKTFKTVDYPANDNDYSIQVIHIAEGVNGELFVYTYQPCRASKKYKAKYINMSLENPVNKDIKYSLYSLTWLNGEGVFDKYIVNNFTVSDTVDRYYNIATIYRPYDDTVDDKSEAVDTIQCKGFAVGQYWHTYYYNDDLCYESKKIDVVEIDITATGSVRYPEGFYLDQFFVEKNTDSHYVAFSIKNYTVDQIIDADITYRVKTYGYYEYFSPYSYREDLQMDMPIYSEFLSSTDVGSNDGGGWFGKKYKWHRITDTNTFIQNVRDDLGEDFSEEELNGLKQSQFVFRFKETSYSETWAYDASSRYGHYSICDNIGVLRLHFISDNKTYNLGCVSDLVGTDSIPEIDGDLQIEINDLNDAVEVLFMLVCFIIFLL